MYYIVLHDVIHINKLKRGVASMDSFLKKVHNAVKSMGEAPYDDKKTEQVLAEATKKTIELCNSLKDKSKML